METVLLLLLLGTWGGMFWMYRRFTREIDDLARERVEQTETQASLARMVAQLQEAADELAQAMSARTGRLRALLEQADRRAADLAEALTRVQHAQVQARFETQRHDAQRHERAISGAALAPRAVPPTGPAPAPASAPGANGLAKTSALGKASPEVGQVADADTHGNAHNGSDDEVRRLAALGLSQAEIAQRTHRGREEVRLLLQLLPQARITTAGTAGTQNGTAAANTIEGTTR